MSQAGPILLSHLEQNVQVESMNESFPGFLDLESGCKKSFPLRGGGGGVAFWLVQPGEHTILDLGVVSSITTLGVEST